MLGELILAKITPAQHINFGRSRSPEISPKSPKRKGDFREFPGRGYLWKLHRTSAGTPNFPEFPSASRFQQLGVPIFSMLGGNEVDMLRNADVKITA